MPTKVDYINELERRHGKSPEIEELRWRASSSVYAGQDPAIAAEMAKIDFRNSVELGIPLAEAEQHRYSIEAAPGDGKVKELFQRYVRDPITKHTGLFPHVTEFGDPRRSDRTITETLFKQIPTAAGMITADYVSGLGLQAPDVIAQEFDRYVLDSEKPVTSMSELVHKIAGDVELGNLDEAAQKTGKLLQFMGGMKTARKILGPLLNRLPVRQALRLMLGGGLEFGVVSATQEVAEKITKGEDIDWGRIRDSAGWGVLFGGAESVVGKILQYKDVNAVLKAEPRLKVIPKKLLRKVVEAGQAKASGMTRGAWTKVYGEDMKTFVDHMREIAAVPLLEGVKAPPVAKPVEAVEKPVPVKKPAVKPTEAITKPSPVAPVAKRPAKGVAVPPKPTEAVVEGAALVRIENGKPQVKFPEDTEFGPLTEAFSNKSIEEVISRLEKLPANEGVVFQQAPLEPVPGQEPRLPGGAEAGGTTIIPDIVTEATETGRRLGSTITGAAKATKEIYSRNVKRYTTHLKTLGPSGKVVSRDFDEITQRAQKRINNSVLDAKEILKGVNKENREQIAKFINGRIKKVPKWIQQRADKLRAVLDELLDEANAVGIKRRVAGEKVGLVKTGKAFPQVLNAQGERILKLAGKHGANSPEVLEVAQEMVEAGLAKSVESYIADLQRFRNDQLRGVSGYLERTRVELPERFLEFDPDRVLDRLFQKNWLFVEGTRQWGIDKAGLSFPKLAMQVESLRSTHGVDEAQQLEQFVKAAFGNELLSSEASRKISGAIRGYQFLTKIALSPLTITRNMLDRFNKVASFAPLSVQLKTLAQYPPFINIFLKHSRKIEEEMIRRGAVFSNTAIGEGYQPGHLATKLAGKLFTSSELGNQVFIAQAKKNAIDHNLKILRTNPNVAKVFDKRLGKLLTPLETIGRSPTQAIARLAELNNEELLAKLESVEDIPSDLLDVVLHRTVRDMAFPVVLSTKRSWWDNKPFIRMATQFKIWGTDQVGHIWNDVVKDTVQNRDPSKMVGWLVMLAAMGEIYNILRDFILGKDESLVATLSNKERRNLKDISITVLKDMVDGGAVGIMSDILYGLPNLIGGPTLGTVKNLGDATVKTVWNPTQAKDAITQISTKESPAIRQVQGVFDKIDARFSDKNITQEYYKVRTEAFKWTNNKKYPGAVDKAKKATVQAIVGWVKNVPQERTLSYEMAIRQILVGDADDASEHLFFLLKRAKDDEDELLSTEQGIKSALNNAAPLGRVAEKDLGEFFKGMSTEKRRSIVDTQMKYDATAAEALNLAVKKWQEWIKEQ